MEVFGRNGEKLQLSKLCHAHYILYSHESSNQLMSRKKKEGLSVFSSGMLAKHTSDNRIQLHFFQCDKKNLTRHKTPDRDQYCKFDPGAIWINTD